MLGLVQKVRYICTIHDWVVKKHLNKAHDLCKTSKNKDWDEDKLGKNHKFSLKYSYKTNQNMNEWKRDVYSPFRETQ